MTLFISRLLSWLSAFGGKFLVDSTLKFIATKVLVYSLLCVTFPIVIKNLIVWLVVQVQSLVAANMPAGSISTTALQLSGLCGYIGSHLMLSTCISIILSAIAIRFVLNFIPFVG